MATLGQYRKAQTQTGAAADSGLQALMLLMQYMQQREDRKDEREWRGLQMKQMRQVMGERDEAKEAREEGIATGYGQKDLDFKQNKFLAHIEDMNTLTTVQIIDKATLDSLLTQGGKAAALSGERGDGAIGLSKEDYIKGWRTGLQMLDGIESSLIRHGTPDKVVAEQLAIMRADLEKAMKISDDSPAAQRSFSQRALFSAETDRAFSTGEIHSGNFEDFDTVAATITDSWIRNMVGLGGRGGALIEADWDTLSSEALVRTKRKSPGEIAKGFELEDGRPIDVDEELSLRTQRDIIKISSNPSLSEAEKRKAILELTGISEREKGLLEKGMDFAKEYPGTVAAPAVPSLYWLAFSEAGRALMKAGVMNTLRSIPPLAGAEAGVRALQEQAGLPGGGDIMEGEGGMLGILEMLPKAWEANSRAIELERGNEILELRQEGSPEALRRAQELEDAGVKPAWYEMLGLTMQEISTGIVQSAGDAVMAGVEGAEGLLEEVIPVIAPYVEGLAPLVSGWARGGEADVQAPAPTLDDLVAGEETVVNRIDLGEGLGPPAPPPPPTGMPAPYQTPPGTPEMTPEMMLQMLGGEANAPFAGMGSPPVPQTLGTTNRELWPVPANVPYNAGPQLATLEERSAMHGLAPTRGGEAQLEKKFMELQELLGPGSQYQIPTDPSMNPETGREMWPVPADVPYGQQFMGMPMEELQASDQAYETIAGEAQKEHEVNMFMQAMAQKNAIQEVQQRREQISTLLRDASIEEEMVKANKMQLLFDLVGQEAPYYLQRP
jgi:hypothetical protein